MIGESLPAQGAPRFRGLAYWTPGQKLMHLPCCVAIFSQNCSTDPKMCKRHFNSNVLTWVACVHSRIVNVIEFMNKFHEQISIQKISN